MFYEQPMAKWLRTNPGKTVTQPETAGFLTVVYGKAVTVSNAMNCFRAKGLWPVDRTVFSDHDFCNLNLSCDKAITEEVTYTYPTTSENLQETKIYFTASSVSSPPIEASRNSKIGSPAELVLTSEKIGPVPEPTTEGEERQGKTVQEAIMLTSSVYKKALEMAKRKNTNTCGKDREKTAKRKRRSRRK
jgi:hypothetical protein